LVLGTLVLGLGGRLVMRATARLAGHPGGFSVGGSLEVLLIGAMFGVVGGGLLPAMPARLRWFGPPLHAAALFVIIGLTSAAARSAAASLPAGPRATALALFYVLLAGYSTLLHVWYRRRPL
jgi:hypothetical protein